MIRLCIFVILVPALVAACGRGARNDLRNGGALYAANCAVCHGGDARGGGGVGVAGLSKTPPDLTRLRADNGGVFPVRETVDVLEDYADGGVRGRQMTGFSTLKSDRRKRVRVDRVRVRTADPVKDLLLFLESVQRP